jgi:hypothetical protein
VTTLTANAAVERVSVTCEATGVSGSGTTIGFVSTGTASTDPAIGAYFDIQASPGASGTLNQNSTGSSRPWVAFTISIKPAAGPTITSQPSSVAVYVGQTANFTISATGTGTLHYQWKVNGSNVGTDANSYTTGATVLADDGNQITCDVTDDNGTVTSATAILTVLPTVALAWVTA